MISLKHVKISSNCAKRAIIITLSFIELLKVSWIKVDAQKAMEQEGSQFGEDIFKIN